MSRPPPSPVFPPPQPPYNPSLEYVGPETVLAVVLCASFGVVCVFQACYAVLGWPSVFSDCSVRNVDDDRVGVVKRNLFGGIKQNV